MHLKHLDKLTRSVGLLFISLLFCVVSLAIGMAFQHAELNDFLATRSYIEGYVPSQADVAVLEHLGGVAVDASLFHLQRWQRHINSYSAQDKVAFPGIKKVQFHLCGVFLN